MGIKFLVVMSALLMGCAGAPISPVAPTVVRVEGVEAESLSDEPPYIPTARWTVYAYLPGNDLDIRGRTDDVENGDIQLDGSTYKWGGVTASVTLEGRNIRLDCSTGTAGTVTCLSDEGVMQVTCERMVFKFKCSLR